jgi:hypothetical protein
MISRPSMFALHTLLSVNIRLPVIIYRYSHAPFLGQPKLFYPEHSPHLHFQSVGPLKLIEVVLNGVGASTGDDPLIERGDLLREIRDVLGTLVSPILESEDLFVQPFHFGLVSRPPNDQLLSKVQVVVRCRSRAGLPVRPGKAIHPVINLTHEGHSNECMFR